MALIVIILADSVSISIAVFYVLPFLKTEVFTFCICA